MRESVREFVRLVAEGFDPGDPVVEIGARQVEGQEGYADLRVFFPGRRYIGCDVEPGPGVDRLEDAHALSFESDSVGTVLCVDTLEHVADPFVAVGEMRRVLRPGGLLILVVPFFFPIHHAPDYTRLTPEGVARLLRRFEARAVFSEGEPQSPHTVHAVALKSGGNGHAAEDRFRRLEAAWRAVGRFAPLLRYRPVRSALRWDHPARGLPLEPGVPAVQTFRCPADGLERIDVRLRPRQADVDLGEVALTLRDPDGVVLGRATAELRFVWRLGDPPLPRWVAFPLGPLEGAAARELSIELVRSGGEGGLEVLAGDRPDRPPGDLSIGGRPEPGMIAFEVFCRREEAPGSPDRGRGAGNVEVEELERDAAPVPTVSAPALTRLERQVDGLRAATEEVRRSLAAGFRADRERLDGLERALGRVENRLETVARAIVDVQVRQHAQGQSLERLASIPGGALLRDLARWLRVFRSHRPAG